MIGGSCGSSGWAGSSGVGVAMGRGDASAAGGGSGSCTAGSAASTVCAFGNDTTAAPLSTRNDTVKAERADYFDVGISQVLLPGLTVGLDGYYKNAKNLIDEGQFGAPIIQTAFNYRHARVYGVEFATSYDQGPLSLYGNAAWSRAVGRRIVSSQFNFDPGELAYIDRNDISLDHDQRWTGSAGAAWTLNRDTAFPTRLSADLLVQSGLRTSTATVPNGAALPGYAVLNLSVVQKLDLGIGRGTLLRLDVLNATDEKYRIRDGGGVGVGAPQFGLRRAVLAGITQRF